MAESYRSFRHPDVCPVVELGDNHYLLDLTQGPTLAFKDVALQLLGRMLDQTLGVHPTAPVPEYHSDSGRRKVARGDKPGRWILEASLAAMSAEKAAFPCAASRTAASSTPG